MNLERHLFTPQLLHRLLEQPHVHVESDRPDVPVLLAAQQIAGAAQFQVERRDLETRTEVAELLQRRQPLARDLAEFGVLGNQQISVGAAVRPADAAAQLVQLRKPVPLGVLDDHRVRQRDVEAVLDDGGAHEHVVFVPHEAEQHLLQFRLAHLPVPHADAAVGQQFLNVRRARENGVHAVVDEVDLAAARSVPVRWRS